MGDSKSDQERKNDNYTRGEHDGRSGGYTPRLSEDDDYQKGSAVGGAKRDHEQAQHDNPLSGVLGGSSYRPPDKPKLKDLYDRVWKEED